MTAPDERPQHRIAAGSALTEQTQAQAILSGLGGLTNIEEIEPCTTRLRCLVKNPALVDSRRLRAAGTFGVMAHGRVVQVVVGPHVDTLASDLDELM